MLQWRLAPAMQNPDKSGDILEIDQRFEMQDSLLANMSVTPSLRGFVPMSPYHTCQYEISAYPRHDFVLEVWIIL